MEAFKEQEIMDYVVAEEVHKNGDPHLHVWLKLKNAVNTRNCKFADIGGYHGNYQGVRSNKCVIKYCTKAENYIASIDVGNLCDARKNHRK